MVVLREPDPATGVTEDYMMLVKHTAGKVNFIDVNDAFVGFDYTQDCCEDFGYYMAPTVVPLADASTTDDAAVLHGFIFLVSPY